MFRFLSILILGFSIIYISNDDDDDTKNRRQASSFQSFSRCIAPRTVSFMITWGPSIKTGSLLNAFTAGNLSNLLMINPNSLNSGNNQAIATGYHKQGIIGMIIPLWAEDVTSMSAETYAQHLKTFADQTSAAMGLTGLWPKYIRIPTISKNKGCLVDTTPMVNIANQMGFVVVQNTKGDGDLRQESDASIMTNYMNDNSGYIFSIEDSQNDSLDEYGVEHIIASAQGKGYNITSMTNCIGLNSESKMRTSILLFI